MKKFLFMIILALPIFNTGCGSRVEAKKEEAGSGIKTTRASSQELQTFIEATGSIQLDLEGGAKVVSPLGGVVDRIFVKVGDRVKKGVPLVAIRSSDVSDTYSSFLSIQSQFRQAERIYNLNKELFQVGSVTKNDLINSEASYEQLKAQEEGLKRKLEIYGVNPANKGSIQDSLVLKAPMDGVVAEIQTHTGDRIDTSTQLMAVADPSKIVVVANIYDTDVQKVRKGNGVVFQTDLFQDRSFKGTVSYVSDVEDPDSKTVKTYIKLKDGGNLFKQNMFLKIKIAEGKKSCPVVPKTALLYKDGEFYVYVKGKQGYELKKVLPIREVTEKLMAVEGLTESDEVMLSAIDMEKP